MADYGKLRRYGKHCGAGTAVRPVLIDTTTRRCITLTWGCEVPNSFHALKSGNNTVIRS